jgi:hypothetical protein
VTQAALAIGGPQSCSSEGFNDPGKLSDGITEASAVYTFTLDVGAATLTVEVVNTSLVLVGIPNPLLTDAYFNAPAAANGLSLVSQVSAAGAAPAFVLTFDADLADGSNPNGADGFGAYSAALNNPGGISGAIANASADTLDGPPGSQAIGPVTFAFAVTGDLTGVVAADFANSLSHIPPGTKQSRGVGKFQAGGAALASAFISAATGPCAEAAEAEARGEPCGATLSGTPPLSGGTSTLVLDGNTPTAPGAIFFSTYTGASFSFQGCEIFLNPVDFAPIDVFVTDANGDHVSLVPVPNDAELCGFLCIFQGLVLGDNGPLPIGEISNAVLLKVGI